MPKAKRKPQASAATAKGIKGQYLLMREYVQESDCLKRALRSCISVLEDIYLDAKEIRDTTDSRLSTDCVERAKKVCAKASRIYRNKGK